MFHIVYGARGSSVPTRVSTSRKAYPETRWPLMHMISDGLRPGEAYLGTIGHFEGPLSAATAGRILQMRSAPASGSPVGHFPFEALEARNVQSRTDFIQSLRFGSEPESLFPKIGWPEPLVLLEPGAYKRGEISIQSPHVFFPLTLEWLSQFSGYIGEKMGKYQLLRKDIFENPLTLGMDDCSTLLQRLNVFTKPHGYLLRLPSYPMTEALFPAPLKFEDSEVNPVNMLQSMLGRTEVLHYLRDVLNIAVMPTSSEYERMWHSSSEPREMKNGLSQDLDVRRYYHPEYRYVRLASPSEEMIVNAGNRVPNTTFIIQRTAY